MKAVAVFLLAAAFIGIGLLLYRQGMTIDEQLNQIAALKIQLDTVKKASKETGGRIEAVSPQPDANKPLSLLESAPAGGDPIRSIELKRKCAEQAGKAFRDAGFGKTKQNTLVSYENHYNARLNKCFIEISYTDIQTATKAESGYIYVDLSVYDAFEQKEYADFTSRDDQEKPLDCHVTLLGGDKWVCRSEVEFKRLIKDYMENR